MMSCIRCQGLMMEERMIDMEAGYGEMWSRSWRCFNCGHRHDAVIQQHRKTHVTAGIVSPEALTIDETVELPWDSDPIEPLAA
ncbi:MAG: hypothetical protein H8K03_01300 [Nitrospira sp.]